MEQKPFEDLWNPDNNLEALRNNYLHTENFIKADLAFYRKEREASRLYSKIVKFLTIGIICVATCLPLLNFRADTTDAEKLDRATWCYVLLSVAGSLFLLDKYLGFTTKWIRLKTTELNLSIALSDFIQDWIIFLATVNGQFTKELYVEGQQKISALRKKVDDIKKLETQDWLKEYQQSMIELSGKVDKMSQQAATDLQTVTEQQKKGSLILKIANAQKFDTIKLKLDDVAVKDISKRNESLIENLVPKHYSLLVTGTLNKKETSFDKIIEITAKNTTTETITIPE